MLRRAALKSVASAVTTGIAGCTGDGTGGTDTPTATKQPTDTPTTTDQPTDTPPQANDEVIEYLVRNDDDASHRLEVVIENAEGTVIYEQLEPELAPGEQIGGSSFGYEPDNGPYSISISLQSLSLTIEWDPAACLRLDLLVAITANGELEVEREECIK